VNPNVNKILDRIPRSGLRSITEKAQSEYGHFSDLILLGYGQPLDPPSDILCEAIQEAGRKQLTKYTPNQGTLEFREAVVEKMSRSNIKISVDDVFATPGATYGLAVTLGCVLNSGDGIMIPDPGYPNFSAVSEHYGGIVNYYILSPENDFEIDTSYLDSMIHVGRITKAVIINTPSNPTGAVLSKQAILDLVELAESHGIWLICDEVYDELTYGRDHFSPLSTGSKNVISIFSLSKTYNLCGLRAGYIVSRNEDFKKVLLNSQEFYISCAPAVSQYVGTVALRDCSDYVESLRKSFESKLKMAHEHLGGLSMYNVRGAFYKMIDTSNLPFSSLQLSLDLLEEEHVAVAPGSTFGPSSDGYLRISLIPEPEKIQEGIMRIKRFLERKHELAKK